MKKIEKKKIVETINSANYWFQCSVLKPCKTQEAVLNEQPLWFPPRSLLFCSGRREE
jgi:hypothetical protein